MIVNASHRAKTRPSIAAMHARDRLARVKKFRFAVLGAITIILAVAATPAQDRAARCWVYNPPSKCGADLDNCSNTIGLPYPPALNGAAKAGACVPWDSPAVGTEENED